MDRWTRLVPAMSCEQPTDMKPSVCSLAEMGQIGWIKMSEIQDSMMMELSPASGSAYLNNSSGNADALLKEVVHKL